jgi:hypothetical protein
MGEWVNARSAADFTEAISSGVTRIEVEGTLSGMPSVTLPPGVSLRGGGLAFRAKGLCLTADNKVSDMRIVTVDHETAIYNDTSVADMGTLLLSNVSTVGQVYLVADNNVRAGKIVAEGVRIESADVRGRFDRPHGFGVDALQGGFTLWNRQADRQITITARLTNISAGSEALPIRGSGVFVGGHGDRDGHGDGGVLYIELLSTGEIVTDGGIQPGTPDLISGGVFVISGARVDEVVNLAPVTTRGQNDMALDNWGQVGSWTAKAPITSRGPSGIGFVNFGELDALVVEAPIETFGLGARGFNVYDGSLRSATFESIATHGDGSVGIQVSRALPILDVLGDLSTTGGEGESLVKGELVHLSAVALSVKPGGQIGTAHVGGDVTTSGDEVTSIEIEGAIDNLSVDGVVKASGANATGIRLTDYQLDPANLRIEAPNGTAVSFA